MPESILATPTLPRREVYLDNLRIYLTILVIFHHAAVTYGAPGGWYYSEPGAGLATKLMLTLLVSTNQSFFMGLFFFLSAFFALPSLQRKGPLKFVLGRLKRLGIPLIVYSMVLAPSIVAMLYQGVNFTKYATDGIHIGVLWFTAALLIFTLLYVALAVTNVIKTKRVALPNDRQVLLSGVGLGVIAFLVRIVYPIGETVTPLEFQPAHFTQYIVLFTLGLVAYRGHWLEAFTYQRGRKWLWISVALVVIGFPCMFIFKTMTHAEMEAFLGGGTVLSFINALWEQLLGVSIIMALLGLGKTLWTRQGSLGTGMSRSAYAVYIIHPLVLVMVSIVLRDFQLPAWAKFLVAGSVATLISFFVGALLVRIPVIRNVI